MAFPLKSSRVKNESESGKCVEEVFQNGDRDIRRKAHPHYKEFMIDNIDPKTPYTKELGGFQMGRPMKWAHLDMISFCTSCTILIRRIWWIWSFWWNLTLSSWVSINLFYHSVIKSIKLYKSISTHSLCVTIFNQRPLVWSFHLLAPTSYLPNWVSGSGRFSD